LQGSGDVATGSFSGSQTRKMLHLNDDGPFAVELQEKLNAAGAAPPVEPTGIFDAQTRRALIALQRGHGLQPDGIVGPLTWGALDRLTGTPGQPTGPDLHAGAHVPTKTESDQVQKLLHPESGGADDTPWDGRKAAGGLGAVARLTLKNEMKAAMEPALTKIMVDVKQWKDAPRLDVKDLEPAGHEAKRLADDAFSPLVKSAARTQSQESGLAAFDYTAGVNLFDAAKRPVDAFQGAAFIAFTDPAAKAATNAHHLRRDRSDEEGTFFDDEIASPFAADHKDDLETFERFGFSVAKGGKVFAQTTLSDPKFSNDAGPKGAPSPGARHLKWKMLHTLVHEYIHLLEHPAYTDARQGNDIMREGFCEMFAKEVMIPVTAAAKGGDSKLRVAVEGGDFPGFTPDLVPDYKPAPQYADFLKAAEGIRDAVGVANAKAAFFQGHVELLGLTTQGKQAPPAADGSDGMVKVPAAVSTPFALAVLTGADQAAITAANPGLPPNGPLPSRVRVPGTRYHRVVEAIQRDPDTDKTVARQGETGEEIAAQNGITLADLMRANPGLNRRVPKPGEELLIPVRA
ncbi:MAG: hypothetical protein QOE28_896, partial [Solirubrobacteraceae bacterium]|nr:hypothetical protein [Solirubrobacteraceae bacterium]